MPLLAPFRKIFFYGYTFMLLGVGASGIFIAPWELTHIFQLPLASLSPEVQATMLTQYRFLKSAELSFGLFCYCFRADIFQRAKMRHLFVAMVYIGVGARVLSLLVDGRPNWAFIAFAALEFVTGTLMLI
jgi:hypothetical protein